jgi:hypothetical protein
MKNLEIHPVQAKILLLLSKKENASFSELNINKLPNDWFSFHIRNLKKKEFIIKNKDTSYSLTKRGKTLSLKLNEEDLLIERDQRISIEVVLEHEGKFLFQKRLKEPYFGYYEFPSEKIKFGETPLECAIRTLEKECGIKADFEFKGVNHKVDLNEENNIMDDKYFLVLKAKFISGDLIDKFDGGENFWLSKKEIYKLKKVHFDVENVFKIFKADTPIITDITATALHY